MFLPVWPSAQWEDQSARADHSDAMPWLKPYPLRGPATPSEPSNRYPTHLMTLWAPSFGYHKCQCIVWIFCEALVYRVCMLWEAPFILQSWPFWCQIRWNVKCGFTFGCIWRHNHKHSLAKISVTMAPCGGPDTADVCDWSPMVFMLASSSKCAYFLDCYAVWAN